MVIQCLTSVSSVSRVVTLSWYSGKNGLAEADQPTLVIAYDNGRMQIMRNENDDSGFITCV